MKKKMYSIFAALLAVAIALPSSVTLPKTAFADGETGTSGTTTESTAKPTDDPNATLPPRIMNGSFEQPAIRYDELDDYDNEKHDGSWQNDGLWYLKSPDELNRMAKDERGKDIQNPGFYWKTTSFKDHVEMVLSNAEKMGSTKPYYEADGIKYCYRPYLNSGSKNLWMKDGTQCAELVPEDQSSLYQNISTTPGAMLTWALSHRARTKGITDVMALFIGPVHSDDQIKKRSANSGSKDIFMWMAELLKNKGVVPDFSNGSFKAGEKKECVLYLDPNFNLDKTNGINENNYENYISLTPTTTINEKWSCWIMASNVDRWYDYAGKYDVPEGQTATTLAFTALNGKKSGNSANSELNEGNLLDDIRFSITYPLRVSTTSGGSGTVTAQGLDENGNPVNNKVTVTEDHDNGYVEGTHVTISATPDKEDGQEYVFLGANVDGKYVPAKVADNEDNNYYTIKEGTYSFNIKMDQPHSVQLIFYAKGKIIYDPNGGTYNGSDKPTEVNMAPKATVSPTYPPEASSNKIDLAGSYTTWHNPVGDAKPKQEDMRFIGWFFARGGSIIKSNHKVTYIGQTGSEGNTNAIDEFNVEYTQETGENKTLSSKVQDGITFIAQYEYLQEDIAQTANAKGEYTNSTIGGTVSLSIQDFVTKEDRVKNIDGLRQSGFGRLRDTVTMTATANSQYTFMGWYDKEGNLVQHGNELIYYVDKPHTYYARFKRNEGIRYVSFVSESEVDSEKLKDTPFADGSHVKGYTHTIDDNGNITGFKEEYKRSIQERMGGKDMFGNTISTGFTIGQKVKGEVISSIQWTITIPTTEVTDKNLNTYVKNRDTTPQTLFQTDGEAVLTDSVTDNNYFNKGKIFKVKDMKQNGSPAEITAISAGDALWEYYGLGSVGNAVGDSDISSDETDFIEDENGGVEVETDGEISDAVDEFEPIPEEDLSVFEDPFAEEMNLAQVDDNGNIVITLKRSLSTEITGGTTIVYGLVIDNLYAPRSTVSVSFDGDANVQDISDLDNRTDALTSEGYRKDEKTNKYAEYEFGKSTSTTSN